MKKKEIWGTLLLVLISFCTQAQLNPSGTIYFQNLYRANPAMAGLEEGLEISGAYKAQFNAVEGAPAMQTVSAAYGLRGGKVALGLLFGNESAGVLSKTNLKATYAYHLPLGKADHSFLDFGLSAGILSEWVNFDKVSGDPNDLILSNFNQRKAYLDADFGIAYRKSNLSLQAALPNLKRLFDRDLKRAVAENSIFMVSAGYQFASPGKALCLVEPKVMYRGLDNYKDIVDIALNTHFWKDQLLCNIIYHSNDNLTIGIGTVYHYKLSVMAMYTTSSFGIQDFNNNEFEVGLKYNFR